MMIYEVTAIWRLLYSLSALANVHAPYLPSSLTITSYDMYKSLFTHCTYRQNNALHRHQDESTGNGESFYHSGCFEHLVVPD
jgi:hypothetical protein